MSLMHWQLLSNNYKYPRIVSINCNLLINRIFQAVANCTAQGLVSRFIGTQPYCTVDFQASIVRFLKPEERVQNAVKELCNNTFESHAELCANILGDIYKMFVSYLRAFFPAKAICTSMSFCSDTKVTYCSPI